MGAAYDSTKKLVVQPAAAARYPQYYRACPYTYVDVYRVHDLFGLRDEPLCHASKKILLCGVRTGGKPAVKDIEEAVVALKRWLEMQQEHDAFYGSPDEPQRRSEDVKVDEITSSKQWQRSET